MNGVSKTSSTSKKSPGSITKQAPAWNNSTSIPTSTGSSKGETPTPRKPSNAPRRPAAPSPVSSLSTGLRKATLNNNNNQKPNGGTSTTGTKALKPAPATTRAARQQHQHQLNSRLNRTPPLTPSRMSERRQQQSSSASPSASASASTPDEAPETPVELFTSVCSDPQNHPGSSTRPPSPVNEFFMQRSWIKGPPDPEGRVVALSDRPSLCMSVSGWELAVGSSDHAIYTIDLQTCGVTRIMHGKSYGHTEWVTCVDHLPDGRIISGGMDSKLCLWEKWGVRSRDLRGHSASVSGVKAGCFNQGTVAVSSSYDRSLILWDLGGTCGKEIGKLMAHRAPVMEFATVPDGRLVSGCRDGTVILWDAGTKSPVLQCKNAHKGHVTSMKSLEEDSGEVFLSGGQDGLLQVWDFRCRKPVHLVSLHRSAKGIGALTGIAVSTKTTCGCPLITTAGADRLVKVLDPRGSFKVVHTLEDHQDFIYSLYMNGSFVWSGGGDGNLLVHDAERGKCLYGLGAIKNGAVRGISLAGEAQERLVVTGDDGNVMIYSL